MRGVERLARVEHVLEDIEEHDEVEGVVPAGERLGEVAVDHLVEGPCRTRVGRRRGHRLDAHHPRARGKDSAQRLAESACGATDIEHRGDVARRVWQHV